MFSILYLYSEMFCGGIMGNCRWNTLCFYTFLFTVFVCVGQQWWILILQDNQMKLKFDKSHTFLEVWSVFSSECRPVLPVVYCLDAKQKTQHRPDMFVNYIDFRCWWKLSISQGLKTKVSYSWDVKGVNTKIMSILLLFEVSLYNHLLNIIKSSSYANRTI